MPYAPVNTPADLYEDPYLMGNQNRMLAVNTGHKTIRLPALPFESSAFEFSVRRQPPRLGEHTSEILQELKLSNADIDRLAKNKVVMIA